VEPGHEHSITTEIVEEDRLSNLGGTATADYPDLADGSRARRVRKSCAINLKACMCGIDVSEVEIQAGDRVVQCKVQGCEMGWVCHDLKNLMLA
jgi:hypothetical protein